MIVKLRSYPAGGRVHTRVFCGQDHSTLQLAGELILDLREWQLVIMALMFGAHYMTEYLTVQLEGDASVIAAFSDTTDKPPEGTKVS